MIKSNQLPQLDQGMCLICDRQPKAGTDDMCDECASILARATYDHRREYAQWSKHPPDRRRRTYQERDGDDASPFQEHAIRMHEDFGS